MQTASDAIEYLMSSVGGGAQDAEHRVLRQALFHAYRDLVTVREWRWYHATEELDVDTRYFVHILPWGVQSVDSVTTQEPTGSDWMAHYVSPRDFDRILHDQDNYNSRLIWTISLSEVSPDRYALRILSGLGDIAGRVTLTYRRRPRDIRLTGYEPASRIGTVNWSGIEASGVGTNFTNLMMGAVIRVSGDSAYHPEGLTGLHAYADEGLIYKIANSTKLYAWSPAGGMNYSGTKYIITDYLDLSPGMYSALLSGAEVWAARLLGKNIEGSVGVYGRDLRLAFESDAVSPLSGRDYGCAGYSPYWWLYLRPGSDQGTGGGGVGGPDANGVCPIKPPLDGGDSDGPWAYNVDGGNAGTIYGDCG